MNYTVHCSKEVQQNEKSRWERILFSPERRSWEKQFSTFGEAKDYSLQMEKCGATVDWIELPAPAI